MRKTGQALKAGLRALILGGAAWALLAGPGAAQMGGLGGGLGGLGGGLGSGLGRGLGGLGAPGLPTGLGPAPGLGGLGGSGYVPGGLGVGDLGEGQSPTSLLDLRRARLEGLIHANRKTLEADRHGDPVRRGEILAGPLSADVLAKARAAGFRVAGVQTDPALGLSVTTLIAPRGKSVEAARAELQALSPDTDFDLNPIYEPAGRGLDPAPGGATPGQPLDGAIVGMIDGGVGASPVFSHAHIEQRGFAPGGPRATGHGTAVASLIVGEAGAFHGAAPGRTLLAADIYGGQEAAGSAQAVVAALDWLVSRRVKVINMSLVGPPNALLARAVAAAEARGVLIVAAVGNDGPAAPAPYPASYSGVIAVTAVDAHNRALPEAGRPSHLDFAAPGADLAAAAPGKGFVVVRGTSFAAPLVSARLSLAPDEGGAAVAEVAREAVPGQGPVGRGVVCQTCRVDPRLVHAGH
ncbi:MAG: S8 family serine peptidase [Alphaproteobacteria bacterium]|nr:S8 family serine peptidase [Alphaproteobacteria bacterium]